ncbi:MAG: hypothetical protein A3H25_02870 [Sphingomonadales bacterium RIFCSPLOWO2_12_FULL_63_15]|nr:MAG: hypothetical protein A3H25_02870 [Sphingomonadales bacterium RIFCSPLOWO2_12_FULL_63_15]
MSAVLNCDAAGCGHVEPVESIIEADIGRPCPKCGANLLTRADFDYWAANIEPMFRMLSDAGLLREAGEGSSEPSALVSFGYHDGKTTIVSQPND